MLMNIVIESSQQDTHGGESLMALSNRKRLQAVVWHYTRCGRQQP